MRKTNIEVNNLTGNRIDKKFFQQIAQKILNYLKVKITDLSIVFVCGARMRVLNRKYRGRDRITDVLTFDYGRLGEIFICLSQAKNQAEKLNHPVKKELTVLLIHGILHLAGYDDSTKNKYNKMVKKQEEVCQKIIS